MRLGFDRGPVKLERRTCGVKVSNSRAGAQAAQRAYGVPGRTDDTLTRMHFPFLDNWRKRNGAAEGTALTDALSSDPEDAAKLLSECELLREHARGEGVELDDTAESLAALDQLPPRWREDPEITPWLGTDAGLYLGSVIVRHVPGAQWQQWPDGSPVVRLSSGRELAVLEEGAAWAVTGSPELSQVYAEVSES